MISHNVQETIRFAQKIAQKLKGGEVIGLTGELGSGKTIFMKGLAEGLKVNNTITSPTFVLLKSYRGKIKNKKIELAHVDAYRIETIEDIKSIGIEDYLNHDDIILAIEWVEKIKEILPKNTIYIKFKHISENEREILFG